MLLKNTALSGRMSILAELEQLRRTIHSSKKKSALFFTK